MAPAQAAERSETAAATSARQGQTPLHWAAYRGDEEQVRQLLAAGTDVNVRLAKGGTPLHLAAYRGHNGVVRLLIAHGAAVNAKTPDGVTPLDWARQKGHRETVQLLEAHGARHGQVAAAAPSEPPPRADAESQGTAPPAASPGNTAASAPTPATQSQASSSTAHPDKAAPPSAPYWVQLGAFSSAQRASAAQALFRERHPALLAGQTLVVKQARVQDRDYYRVQLPQQDRDSAATLCARLEQAGQACRVVAR